MQPACTVVDELRLGGRQAGAGVDDDALGAEGAARERDRPDEARAQLHGREAELGESSDCTAAAIAESSTVVRMPASTAPSPL